MDTSTILASLPRFRGRSGRMATVRFRQRVARPRAMGRAAALRTRARRHARARGARGARVPRGYAVGARRLSRRRRVLRPQRLPDHRVDDRGMEADRVDRPASVLEAACQASCLKPLFLLLVGVIAYAAFIAERKNSRGCGATAWRTGCVTWRTGGPCSSTIVFAQFSTPSPLLHIWSLSIEEQWYVVWPLVLLVAFRARPRAVPAFVIGCIVLAAGSALMAWLHDPHRDPSRRVLRHRHARAGVVGRRGARGRPGLAAAAGALAARSHRAGSLGRALRGVSRVDVDVDRARQPVSSTAAASCCSRRRLIVIAGAVLVRDGYVARVLSMRPLHTLGLVSYGVYLWHWPLFLDADAGPDRRGRIRALRVAPR